MAKVVAAEEPQVLVTPTWSTWGRVIGIGAATGLMYWVLTILLNRFVIEPIACREAAAAACVAAPAIAGNISTVVVAALAIVAMVRFDVARPIIVAVAAAALLWGLSSWTSGLWWLETLGWSVVLYAIAYALFGWIAREANLVLALIVTVIVVVGLRLLTTL